MFQDKYVISASEVYKGNLKGGPRWKLDQRDKTKTDFQPGISLWSLEGKLVNRPYLRSKNTDLIGIQLTRKVVMVDEVSCCIGGNKGLLSKISLTPEMEIHDGVVIDKDKDENPSQSTTIRGLDYDPKSRTLFTGCTRPAKIKFWRMFPEETKLVRTVDTFRNQMVQSNKFLEGTTILASSLGMSTIMFHDLEKAYNSQVTEDAVTVARYKTMGSGDILGMDYDKKNNILISCSGDGSLSFHDVRSRQGVKKVSCDDYLRCVKLIGNDVLCADETCNSEPGRRYKAHLYVIDIRTYQRRKKVLIHGNYVYDILDVGNDRVWTCCRDGLLKIWALDRDFEEIKPPQPMKCRTTVHSMCLMKNLNRLRKWKIYLEDLGGRIEYLRRDDNDLFSIKLKLMMKVKVNSAMITVLKSFMLISLKEIS